MSYDVIVPMKADSEFIHECLASIFSQTLAPASVSLILDKDEKRLDEIRLRVQKEFPATEVCSSTSRGMISAINYGIGKSKSGFLSFLDSDDLWVCDKQEQQVNTLILNPDVDVVTSNAANTDAILHLEKETSWTSAAMFTAATFRREAFQKFGMIDESASHFNWLYRWWANAHQLGIARRHLDRPGVRRRIHAKNSWLTHNSRAHQDLFSELRKIMRRQNHPGA